MIALKSVLKWLGIGALGLVFIFVVLVVLMRLGFDPAAEILFSLAYCLDGYGPCGNKT